MQARMKSPMVIFPDALQALLALNKASEHDGLPHVTRKLVHLRASQINGCGFCVDMHARGPQTRASHRFNPQSHRFGRDGIDRTLHHLDRNTGVDQCGEQHVSGRSGRAVQPADHGVGPVTMGAARRATRAA